jgi:hypothetical protein
MNRGGKFLVSATVLTVAACGGSSGKLEIRSTPTALTAGERPVPFRIAEARGQLALGNVALALEGFRKAWRDDPDSVDALAGMAACYDSMGRYDLSRRNYEAALALAPANVALLGAFAASLEQQGLREDAAAVRKEIAARSAPAVQPQQLAEVPAPSAPAAAVPAVAAPVQAAAGSIAPAGAAQAQAATAVVAPVPAPAPAAAIQPVAVAPETRVTEPSSPPLPAATPAKVPATSTAAYQPVDKPKPAQLSAGSSVTIKLPPPRPAAGPAPAPAFVAAKAARVPMPSASVRRGPRLERLSMGEIAIVSAPGPLWAPTTVAQSARSTTVRFVPLRQASAQPVQVRLLNAARVNRLAARTRSWLAARGWNGISIGNARSARVQSLILYPQSKRALAERLSAQFGFAMAEKASGAQITVLLGRDAARHKALRPSGA